MKRSGTNVHTLHLGSAALILAAVTGCASGPRSRSPSLDQPPVATVAPEPPVPRVSEEAEPRQASVLVVSEPEGAMVVLDGRPLGPTPRAVTLPINGYGFVSRPVSVKVRFVATSLIDTSRTAEVMLTPLDRAPVRLDFTPQGARRTMAALNGR
jgi:hypothetical protein